MDKCPFIVDSSDIQTADVLQGDFKVEVRGIGALKAQDSRWVVAQVNGRVENILIKAGSQVVKGQPMVELSNPALQRELEKAHWELTATQAESQAAYTLLESQLVDLENSVDEAEFNYLSAKLKLDAETALLAQGKASISKLDYRRSQLATKQQKQRWQAQQKRISKMRANLSASQTAQQARLGLVRNNYQRIKEQVADLVIKASTDGVVQQVDLQHGQQVNSGNSVALIANQQKLYAELQIQELQVSRVATGQPVTIDTHSSQMSGKVVRIDPVVSAGMVKVDVALTQSLPAEARPDLNIEGRIQVSYIKDTLFIRRPAYAPRMSQADLFKVNQQTGIAKKQTAQFGESSVNHIQITAGLQLGDTVIVSDTSKWQQHNQVLIN